MFSFQFVFYSSWKVSLLNIYLFPGGRVDFGAELVIVSSTGNCDPEDARFERLESTGSSAAINNLLSYLKHLTATHKVFCLEKKRKKNMVCYHI